MEAPAAPAWSTAVGQADWIDARLSAFDAHQVTSVVPAGFDAYARVLHPAQEPDRDGGRLVRWADVAAWSGLPLGPGAQFHSIALPAERPRSPAPWAGQGPERGDLYLPDAEALAAITRQWTGTPEQCWFCLWDGHDLAGTVLTPPGQRGIRRPAPVPAPVRDGPRVHLPHRDYLLYAGPVEAVTAAAALSVWKVTPNLWWPADRSWCVATEIDLAWTYVGGPAGLIEAVLRDEGIQDAPSRTRGPADWHRGPGPRLGRPGHRPAAVGRRGGHHHFPGNRPCPAGPPLSGPPPNPAPRYRRRQRRRQQRPGQPQPPRRRRTAR